MGVYLLKKNEISFPHPTLAGGFYGVMIGSNFVGKRMMKC